jgi:hypothetical protein
MTIFRFSILICLAAGYLASCVGTESQIAENSAANKMDLSTNSLDTTTVSVDESSAYKLDQLESSFREAKFVLHVDVQSREFIDSVGDCDCERNTGTGYCLYRLKANMLEVFKGKINSKDIQFYTSTDADWKNKERLLGEQIIFLGDWNDNFPDKKIGLDTLENSTLSIKYDVIHKMRKIAKKKN